MPSSLLKDAFDHHVWATLRVIDSCLELSAEQLQSNQPGTFGSILATLQHLLSADASYLAVLTDGRIGRIEGETMQLPELRAQMERHATAWSELLQQGLDPDRLVVRRRDDGSETHAALGIRIAQALHHGTDHRSQICTALTSLGKQPPDIDVWDYALESGRMKETAPTS